MQLAAGSRPAAAAEALATGKQNGFPEGLLGFDANLKWDLPVSRFKTALIGEVWRPSQRIDIWIAGSSPANDEGSGHG